MAGGGSPLEVARVGLGELPSGVGFAVVVGAAGRSEGPVRGGPVRVADRMVDVARRCGAGAGDAAAGLVAHDDVVDEVAGWPVAGGAVVEQPPGGGVGEQPSPGAAGGDPPGGGGGQRPVPNQLARLVVDAEEGGGGAHAR